MKWQLLVRDVESARDWYDEKSEKLGDNFLDEMAAAMEILAAHPDIQRPYHRQFRR